MLAHVRTFGTVIHYGGFAVAFFMIFLFVAAGFGGGDTLNETDYVIGGVGVGGGFLCFFVGMVLQDLGKSSGDFKAARKAGKTKCYACGTKRRIEASCPKCGAPPSSSI